MFSITFRTRVLQNNNVRNVFGASSFRSVPPLGLHVGNLGRYSRSRNPGRPRPFKIEPANVTMELHMGVAWQALIQDVMSLCYRAGSWVWVEQQALNQIIPPHKVGEWALAGLELHTVKVYRWHSDEIIVVVVVVVVVGVVVVCVCVLCSGYCCCRC